MFIKNDTQKLGNFMPNDVRADKMRSIFNRKLDAKKSEIEFRNESEDKKIYGVNDKSYKDCIKPQKSYCDAGIKEKSYSDMMVKNEVESYSNAMKKLNSYKLRNMGK